MGGKGFLGTNANVLQDISLILGILVALTLTLGMIMAIRKRYEAHRWIQTVAVTLNILQVLTIMVGSFFKSAAPGIPRSSTSPTTPRCWPTRWSVWSRWCLAPL